MVVWWVGTNHGPPPWQKTSEFLIDSDSSVNNDTRDFTSDSIYSIEKQPGYVSKKSYPQEKKTVLMIVTVGTVVTAVRVGT